MLRTFLLLACVSLGSLAFAEQEKAVPASHAAQALSVEGVKNLYKISDDLYRGGQPEKEGFKNLEHMGLKSVLNLREYHSDTRKARDTKLKLERMKLAAGEVKAADLMAALRIIDASPKPVLVHCWHGSDRTGIVVAAYRIVVQNWTPEQAEEEFRDKKFGFHEDWYDNLVTLLRHTDWEKLRREWKTR